MLLNYGLFVENKLHFVGAAIHVVELSMVFPEASNFGLSHPSMAHMDGSPIASGSLMGSKIHTCGIVVSDWGSSVGVLRCQTLNNFKFFIFKEKFLPSRVYLLHLCHHLDEL